VHTILQIGTRAVFEGGFDHAVINGDTAIAHSVIAYDGTNVDTLDGGIPNGEFEGLIAQGSDVMVGGAIFTQTTTTTHIATYHCHNVGVKNINAPGINIYPNPATDRITIESSGGTLKILNLTGQVVYNTTLSSNKQTISIKDLLPGVYLIQLLTDSGLVIHKEMIKE
jgi:Secretion system C-terminal sorting domain